MVTTFLRSCLCSISKATNWKHSKYIPCPTLHMSWELVSMDFLRGLVTTNRDNKYLMIVIYCFNEMAMMMHCKRVFQCNRLHSCSLNEF
jgi:hypothetical protein